MTRAFLDEDFLLGNDTARRLYHDYAAGEPIYDYHNHLIPAEIARDRRFDNLAEIWLDGDHYKWRAMRTAGIDEALVTGEAGDHDKFHAFARVVPQCIGNPIYHWTHMELAKPFGIRDRLLDATTAERIWQETREALGDPAFSARGLLRQFGVRMVATTDDPIDSLEHHAAMAHERDAEIDMLPTWRPDRLLKPEHEDFPAWLEALGAAADVEIGSLADLLTALERRLDHFAGLGCVSADHGLDEMAFVPTELEAAAPILERRLDGEPADAGDTLAWRSAFLVWLGRQYAHRGWAMQLHIGAQRDNNTRMLERMGPNTGFDSMGDRSYALPLARFLDTLEREASLPKTILYCINPRDNEMLATMTGNFQGDGVPGKIQFGSAWWFNDQADGIRRQLVSVAQMGLLSRFVGMLTDSRSLLSFSRHEYFRRILCDLLGAWAEAGEVPADLELLGNLVRDVASRNTVAYFGLDGTRA